MKKSIFRYKFVFILACFVSLLMPAQGANPENRIDATHLLAQEIELPERSMGPAVAGFSFSQGQAAQAPVEPRHIGHKELLWLRNFETGKFEQITAVLRSIGKHCFIYLQEGQQVSQSSIDRVRREFDDNIYPTNTSHFGLENKPGLDGEDRIFLLMADIQDGYKNQNDGYVAGFFFAGDQLLQAEYEPHVKVKSNEREILYIDTYPSDPEADDYMEIVAHEFQHMIHHNHDKDELTWVNEGCSQIAPVLCGYAPPGHYRLLKDDPDRSLNYWAKWNPMPDYGQVYLWNQFIIDQALPTPAVRRKFFSTLVASKKKSISGYIDAMTVVKQNFSDLFTRFRIATHLNDPDLAAGTYAYKNPHLRNFRLPPTSHVSVFPAKEKESVKVWSSDSWFADISSFNGKLEISFSGYQRFLGPTRPYFRLAIVLQDSARNLKPKIEFVNLKTNPVEKNRHIGSTVIHCDGKFDNLTAIVLALAPEEICDTKYMPAASFLYDISFVPIEQTPAVHALSRDFAIHDFVAAVENTSQSHSDTAVRIREHYANLLLRTVKKEVEQGSLKTVDNFIEHSSQKHFMAPYSRDISGLLNFYLIQQNAAISDQEIKLRIELLTKKD